MTNLLEGSVLDMPFCDKHCFIFISSCLHASTGTSEEFGKLGNTKILSWLFWADAKIEENKRIENNMVFIIICTIDFLKLN